MCLSFLLILINSYRTMDSERNFRSLYYNKVGCKSVEEKKSLEILFKEVTLDKNKLSEFCARFTVPYMYKPYVWKVLFGVIPVHKSCQDFVMQQREFQYHDLSKAVKALNIASASSSKEHKFLQMWLMEQHRLTYDFDVQLNTEFHQNLLAMTTTFINIFDNDIDGYWIAKGFYNFLKSWSATIPGLVETTKSLLKKEDSVLYGHLESTDLLSQIPINTWFGRCFSGVIHDRALVRVWDKMIGGSHQVLVIVCLVLLTTLRRVLLTCVDISQLLACVKSVNTETSELIVKDSVQMWLTQGRALIPSPHKERAAHARTRQIPARAHNTHA